jgi:hypothetical protein
MTICHLCRKQCIGSDVPADAIKWAVTSGFDPFAAGILRDRSQELGWDLPSKWRSEALQGRNLMQVEYGVPPHLQGQADWHLCPECLAVLKPLLLPGALDKPKTEKGNEHPGGLFAEVAVLLLLLGPVVLLVSLFLNAAWPKYLGGSTLLLGIVLTLVGVKRASRPPTKHRS